VLLGNYCGSNETPDIAGEDSFQAEEAVPGDTAEEGKPSSKT